jgi:hypothetical protein
MKQGFDIIPAQRAGIDMTSGEYGIEIYNLNAPQLN